MNKTRIKTSLITLAVALTSLSPLGALAQPGGDHRGDKRGESHGQSRGPDRGQPEQRGGDYRDNRDYRGDRNDRNGDWRQDRNRGAGPDHNFYTGRRLPPNYNQRRYVVEDWRRHQLRQPPRGYHWVQTGPDYLLVAVATGLIAQIILSN